MQHTKQIELAARAAALWTRIMPDCPPPTQEYLIRWRQQGAYAMLTAIGRTAEKWSVGDFTSPINSYVYCAATCRNIALSTNRKNKAVTRG